MLILYPDLDGLDGCCCDVDFLIGLPPSFARLSSAWTVSDETKYKRMMTLLTDCHLDIDIDTVCRPYHTMDGYLRACGIADAERAETDIIPQTPSRV